MLELFGSNFLLQNSMNPLTNMVICMASLPKKTLYDHSMSKHFDLSFITPQLVVSAGPVDSWWKVHKMRASDLHRWLQNLVQKDLINDWWIWNFKQQHEGEYSTLSLGGKVTLHPVPDHNPPPLRIIVRSVAEISTFLCESKKNLAVIHCNAGKGRSGTMVCAYLMYKDFKEGKIVDLQEVLDTFTSRRMKLFSGPGISIKSQLRYLHYCETVLNHTPEYVARFSMECYRPRSQLVYHLHSLTVHGAWKKQLPKFYLDLHMGDEIILIAIDTWKRSQGRLIWVPSNRVRFGRCDDIKVSFHLWCYFWFVPFFESTGTFIIQWNNIDGFRGTLLKGSKVFDLLEIRWGEREDTSTH